MNQQQTKTKISLLRLLGQLKLNITFSIVYFNKTYIKGEYELVQEMEYELTLT